MNDLPADAGKVSFIVKRKFLDVHLTIQYVIIFI